MIPNWPEARPGDVCSIEALIETFDATLSFAANQFTADLDRLRSLFLPTAAVVSPHPWGLATDASGFVEFYRKAVVDMGLAQTGFAESNTIRRVVTIGSVNSVYSYYSIHSPADNPQAFGCGVNMFHIVRVNGRYAISSLIWEDESESAPTPAEFQPTRS